MTKDLCLFKEKRKEKRCQSHVIYVEVLEISYS